MNPSIVAAAVSLLSVAAAAIVLSRRGRDASAFAFLVAAPVVASLPIAFWPEHRAAPASADPHARATAVSIADAVVDPHPSVPMAGNAARQRGAQARIARDFAAAREAFAEAVSLDPGDADAWADLADASAAASDGDLSAGETALAKALSLDPNHLKALWLRATLELQRKDYAAAARLWERLLALVPPGTNDARIVAANLDEARTLARGGR